MFLLPYGHVQIKSRLIKDIVEQRLAEQVEPRKGIPGIFRGTHKYFEGEINNGHFKINRIPDHKYSFTLVIVGKIQSNGNQTIVDMSVHLDYAVLTTMIIFVSVLTFIFFCFPLQFSIPRNLSGFIQLLIDVLKLPLIFYLVMLFSFNFKAYDILDYLNNLFSEKST